MLDHLTDRELESRLDFLEQTIARTKDWKQLPALNGCLQKILQELADRDVEGRNK